MFIFVNKSLDLQDKFKKLKHTFYDKNNTI